MSRVDFYHLQNQTLENVLPKLVEKAYTTSKNVKIKIGNLERVEFINALLWTYDDTSFIPHGSKKDGFAEQQPIWLSADDDNPNLAEFLFLVDGARLDMPLTDNYSRIFNIFDGNSENAVTQAREFWRQLKAAGHEIFYWQQDNLGRWTQKA